jgi:hypothetical protein
VIVVVIGSCFPNSSDGQMKETNEQPTMININQHQPTSTNINQHQPTAAAKVLNIHCHSSSLRDFKDFPRIAL